MMAPHHFDTQMPSNAEPYHVEKWKLGNFIVSMVAIVLLVLALISFEPTGESD
jgi:hypothetical protein